MSLWIKNDGTRVTVQYGCNNKSCSSNNIGKNCNDNIRCNTTDMKKH